MRPNLGSTNHYRILELIDASSIFNGLLSHQRSTHTNYLTKLLKSRRTFARLRRSIMKHLPTGSQDVKPSFLPPRTANSINPPPERGAYSTPQFHQVKLQFEPPDRSPNHFGSPRKNSLRYPETRRALYGVRRRLQQTFYENEIFFIVTTLAELFIHKSTAY